MHLPRIDPKNRRDDHEFWQMFNSYHGRLLGALMNAALVSTQRYADVVLVEKPRMSAFAVWVAAAEEAIGWKPGRFIAAYTNNRFAAENQMLELNGLASAMMRLMEKQQEFSGTYPDLIAALEMNVGPRESLPKTSHGFAAELRRIRPALERHGLRFFAGGRSGEAGQKGRSRISIVKPEEVVAECQTN